MGAEGGMYPEGLVHIRPSCWVCAVCDNYQGCVVKLLGCVSGGQPPRSVATLGTPGRSARLTRIALLGFGWLWVLFSFQHR